MLTGQVLYQDRFGNLITNIPAGWMEGRAPAIERPSGEVPARWAATYADGGPGEVMLLSGSHGTLEIAVRNGRASDLLALAPGGPVTIRITTHRM
jgi:S-adenosylmethionine hydrolase